MTAHNYFHLSLKKVHQGWVANFPQLFFPYYKFWDEIACLGGKTLN